jgi:SPX domain protein involved in polyphosphate accumulation
MAEAYELKFVLDADLGARIAEWARHRLPADPHGAGQFGDEYRITSLYFDTADYDVLHARGSFGRSKYRVRRYGDSPQVFLERKLRKPGQLHKRRTLMNLQELAELEQPAVPLAWPGRWFHRRMVARQLRPACALSYVRTARVDGLVRLTVDRQIQVRAASGLDVQGGPARDVLTGRAVLELKFRRDMPSIFKALVEQFGVNSTGGSKYRSGMAALGHRTAFTDVADPVHV